MSILFLHFNLFSQSVQFAENFSDRLYLNPALSGTQICPEISLHTRVESFSNLKLNTQISAAYDQYLTSIKGGLGIHILKNTNNQAIFEQTSADLIYSKHFKLKKRAKLTFGFQVSFSQENINYDKIRFPSNLSPHFTPQKNTVNINSSLPFYRLYFASGVAYISKKNHFGLSIHQLSPRQLKKNQENMPKITAYFAKKISFHNFGVSKSDFFILPHFILHQQGRYQQAIYGINITKNSLEIGTDFRHSFAFKTFGEIFLVGISIKNITFKYAYEIVFTRTKISIYNTHQLSIYFTLPCNAKN